MRPGRCVLFLVLAASVLLSGCASFDAEDAERLFDQGGDVVPDEPDEPPSVPEPAEANLTVHVVDVGQGDGIVVHLPDHTAVYDTGRWHGDSSTAVRDHLRAEDADPSSLTISHPDADHAGGCDVVLDAFAVEAIYHPGQAKDTQTWQDCEQAMQDEGAPVRTDAELDLGDPLPWSTHADVRVWHLDATAEDANAGSLVLGLTYGNVTIALTGDATCEAEREMIEEDVVHDVDVAQIAHHGSATSTCRSWLDATEPEAGVVSVGADNTYGHPHEEVLDRLADHGVTVYRTDHHGTVAITTDGTTWDVRTQAGPEPTDPEPPANATGVAIEHVRSDPPGNDNENLTEEWVAIANHGNGTVDLAGWTLGDEAGHTYTFPEDAELASAANLTVHTGEGEDSVEELYWGRSQAVWNNGGDRATLRDAAGGLVDEHAY
jgi:competence protein ComEC